jgi:DNA-binding SARP family transcriptional activator/alpha-beta hydrolase superfamily lysophospholipase
VSALRVFLFGPPRIEQNHTSIEIQRRKTLGLFIYLVITDQPHSRDKLATLFWPDNDQASARANLRRDISRLKKSLGKESLLLDGGNVCRNPDFELWLDVKEFQTRLDEVASHGHPAGSLCPACSAALAEAVDLYSDDFLAGFSLPDSPEFDEWQFFQAEGLRRSLAEALHNLIAWHISCEQYQQAIPYARRWLALDGLHEPAHQALMRLYAWAGEHAAAIRQYQECRRTLAEEMGVEPQEETQALYEAIKSRTLAFPVATSNGHLADSPNAPTSGVIRSAQEGRFSQTIRFCTAPDGVRLAYATTGQGPVLVKAANWLSHLEYDWENPVWRHWLAGLARHNTLVRYDERGCGLSDWDVDDFTLDSWVLDLEAVVDALSLERFPLLGISQGAAIAVEYALRHPEKVSRLILYGGYIRGRYHRNLTPEQLVEQEVLIQMIKIGWGKEHPAFRQVFSTLFLPEGTPEQLHAFNELQRVSTSPEIAARIVHGFQEINVVERARQITQPTLVLHARGDLRIPFEEGRLMAATIPNARLVTLESNNHILLEDEPAWKRFLEEVDAFLSVA